MSRPDGRGNKKTEGVVGHVGATGRRLKELQEVVNGKTSLVENRAKQALADDFTHWHDGLSEWVVTMQDDMASFLTDNAETRAFERLQTFTA